MNSRGWQYWLYTQIEIEHEQNVFHREDMEFVRTAGNRGKRM